MEELGANDVGQGSSDLVPVHSPRQLLTLESGVRASVHEAVSLWFEVWD